jgi:S-adenosylmethionine:tRNA ribosyltransferase-isomerase
MLNDRYFLDDFYYDLPRELIAQYPAEKRDASRLFVLNRQTGAHIHSHFSRLGDFLRTGDLLVFNDAKVMHAKIPCKRPTGGIVDIVLTRRIDEWRWEAISNKMKRLKQGEKLTPLKNHAISLIITKRTWDTLEIDSDIILTEPILNEIGEIALPPYIHRTVSAADEERYQTVFARTSGAIAAPTAGLHFTEDLMEKIRIKGIQTAFVTLHVSWGTFQPVRMRNIENHTMHSEQYTISVETALAINYAREHGSRIIAVGTTALRVLESTFVNAVNAAGSGETDIFIYPPMPIRSINALITNFHTPYSTLLMLVSAFAGHDTIMKAYEEAINLRYRFFSYGDAMMIA